MTRWEVRSGYRETKTFWTERSARAEFVYQNNFIAALNLLMPIPFGGYSKLWYRGKLVDDGKAEYERQLLLIKERMDRI